MEQKKIKAPISIIPTGTTAVIVRGTTVVEDAVIQAITVPATKPVTKAITARTIPKTGEIKTNLLETTTPTTTTPEATIEAEDKTQIEVATHTDTIKTKTM